MRTRRSERGLFNHCPDPAAKGRRGEGSAVKHSVRRGTPALLALLIAPVVLKLVLLYWGSDIGLTRLYSDSAAATPARYNRTDEVKSSKASPGMFDFQSSDMTATLSSALLIGLVSCLLMWLHTYFDSHVPGCMPSSPIRLPQQQQQQRSSVQPIQWHLPYVMAPINGLVVTMLYIYWQAKDTKL